MLTGRSLLATVIAIALATPALAQKKVKLPKPGKAAEVIFIGNSLTHYHDLPAFVRALGAADKPARRLTTVMLAPGGYTLEQHIKSPQEPRPAEVIKDHRAEYVVLQEQGTRPNKHPELMAEYAEQFTALCKKRKSVPVWYMTFARKNEPERQDAVNDAYQRVYERNGGLLAPVGRAWQQLLKDNPKLRLHFADNIHPARRGTYLTACVLYGTMFDGDVRSFPDKLVIKDPNGKDKVLVDLPAEEGQLLREAAASVLAAQYPKRTSSKRLAKECKAAKAKNQ
tara:strand:+ start:42127 stop:42972 length:846 start_codon:yes stop_codon:yes gene_type:complete